MVQEILKTNSVAVSYEMLSDLGKTVNKKQSFNIMSEAATSQDFYDVGVAIGNVLESAPKEITKNIVVLLVEA